MTNIVHVDGSSIDKCTLAQDVIYYCIDVLMPRMKTLIISVEFDPTMDKKFGFLLPIDTREFEIYIADRLEGKELIETICHEMVHVKQFARKELSLYHKSDYKTLEEYLELWHEKEAYALEEPLAAEYISEFEKNE